MIRWIKEIGIMNKVIVIVTRLDTKTGKRGKSNKMIFGCDKGEKYKELDSGIQTGTKNAVIHSKSGQHRRKIVLDGRLM